MRREWLVFEQIYEKLTKELEALKKRNGKIVQIANCANEDREKATTELAELIRQAEWEKNDFDKQIANVNAKIVEEKAWREALKAKETALIEKEKEYKQAKAEEEAFAEK